MGSSMELVEILNRYNTLDSVLSSGLFIPLKILVWYVKRYEVIDDYIANNVGYEILLRKMLLKKFTIANWRYIQLHEKDKYV